MPRSKARAIEYNSGLVRKPIISFAPTFVNTFDFHIVFILGYLFLGEMPSFNSLLGAAITLTGIAMVLI
jgi:drug/metabolite transporter (DMT)-like permease